MIGNHPDQIKHREEQQQIREAAGKYAGKLQEPGPSERMMGNREIGVEQGRDAVAQERTAEAARTREVAEGKRPPIKSYSELHPPDPKTHSR